MNTDPREGPVIRFMVVCVHDSSRLDNQENEPYPVPWPGSGDVWSDTMDQAQRLIKWQLSLPQGDGPRFTRIYKIATVVI